MNVDDGMNIHDALLSDDTWDSILDDAWTRVMGQCGAWKIPMSLHDLMATMVGFDGFGSE